MPCGSCRLDVESEGCLALVSPLRVCVEKLAAPYFFQVVLFVAGIAVQYKVFPPDGMREAREREQARRRQSRYLELNDN